MTDFDFSKVVFSQAGAARTCDTLVFAKEGKEWHALLIERGVEPFLGSFTFPGGFMDKKTDSGPGAAAARELLEETGVVVKAPTYGTDEQQPKRIVRGQLAWVGKFDEPGRDPRMTTYTDAYVAVFDEKPIVTAGDDAAATEWVPVSMLLSGIAGLAAGEKVLAFDHDQMLTQAVALLRSLNVLPNQ